MTKSPFLSITLSVCVLLFCASTLAQEAEHERTPKETQDNRVISDKLSSALSASLPKYTPQKKPQKESKPKKEPERPRNRIIRLPEYVVREKKPPVFSETDLSTDKGLGEIAVDRYFSEVGKALNAFTLPFFGMSKEAYARMLYAQDKRLRDMKSLDQTADDLMWVDPQKAKELRKTSQDTFNRTFTD